MVRVSVQVLKRSSASESIGASASTSSGYLGVSSLQGDLEELRRVWPAADRLDSLQDVVSQRVPEESCVLLRIPHTHNERVPAGSIHTDHDALTTGPTFGGVDNILQHLTLLIRDSWISPRSCDTHIRHGSLPLVVR